MKQWNIKGKDGLVYQSRNKSFAISKGQIRELGCCPGVLLTCVCPEWCRKVSVREEWLKKLSVIFIKQSGESSNTQPEHTHTHTHIILSTTISFILITYCSKCICVFSIWKLSHGPWTQLQITSPGWILRHLVCLLLPVGCFRFQRSVTEAAIAVTQVEVIVMVIITGPTQPVPSCTQVHLHHLINYWQISLSHIINKRVQTKSLFCYWFYSVIVSINIFYYFCPVQVIS